MRISNPIVIQALLKALADDNCNNILALTAHKPLSATDIEKRTNTPISSVYRRISQLEEHGLVGIDRTIITPEGKSYNLYRAVFSQVTIQFRDGTFLVDVMPNERILEKAAHLFYSTQRRKKKLQK
ncbi:MAG: helix-turn-helix domain-containing protein [Candidatus Hodarchaeales archaeon]|jgi:DNA-binding transcriptional ArsR family regulator